MNIGLKNELLKRISETDDDSLLSQVKALLDLHSAGRWEKLPNGVQEAVLRGYKQSEEEKGTDHESLMQKARSWRGK